MSKLHKSDENHVSFHCPGCESAHRIPIAGPNTWQWNKDMDLPTFSPSIKISSGHFIEGSLGCWCKHNAAHPESPSGFSCGLCHSFVKDGKIQFLTDCTHKLAGQTVDIPDWEDS